MSTGLKIEEITDEDPTPSSEMHETLSSNQKTEETNDNMNFLNNTEYLQSLKDDKESIRFVSIIIISQKVFKQIKTHSFLKLQQLLMFFF